MDVVNTIWGTLLIILAVSIAGAIALAAYQSLGPRRYAPELMPRVRSAVLGGVDGGPPEAEALAAMIEEFKATVAEERAAALGRRARRPREGEDV